MKLLPLLLLCACSLPDNVGVSTSAGQRDYLSAEPGGWPLTNGTGDSFGVQVWASWQLKPQRMTLVRSAREIDFDFPKNAPAPVEVNVEAAEDKKKPGIVADVTELGNAANEWSPVLQVAAGLVMIGIAGVGLWLLLRKRG